MVSASFSSLNESTWVTLGLTPTSLELLASSQLHIVHDGKTTGAMAWKSLLTLSSPGAIQHTSYTNLAAILLLPLLLLLLLRGFYWLLLHRPAIPANAPRHWLRHDWPVVGSALRFYAGRRDMQLAGCRDALKHNPAGSGSFSFFVGKKHVVSVGPGAEARRAFFETRGLNFAQGFIELMAGLPSGNDKGGKGLDNWSHYFNKTLTTLLRPENVARHLPAMLQDTHHLCNELLAAQPLTRGTTRGTQIDHWRVTNPFHSVYGTVYQLTTRVIGATEIAESRLLLRLTQFIFERFEKSDSTARLIVPWLITPAYVMRMLWGAIMAVLFIFIIHARKRTHRRHDDALQYLLDHGADPRLAFRFELNALWAGILNTGLNASWLLFFLARHPAWQSRCRAEVDCVVSEARMRMRMRTTRSDADSDSDRDTAPQFDSDISILGSLSLSDWERPSTFPVLRACLRECVRVAAVGTVFRKNTSGRDVVLGSEADASEVVPPGAFAAFVVDHAHMDPRLFPEPAAFRPGRYLAEEEEEDDVEKEARERREKEPHSYLGWGAGMHPCIGARLAGVEIVLLLAHLLAVFEFELSDKHGRPVPDPFGGTPAIDRNASTIRKPAVPIYVRYRPRGSI